MTSKPRVAFVTGASQGIGRAIALRLADDGLDVAINDLEHQKDSLISVATIIEKKGRKTYVGIGDVSNEEEVISMIDSVVKELGGIDVMVANAGICFAKSMMDTTVEDLDRIYKINTRSVFLCYKYAAKQMIEQGRGGRIIGASSGAGKSAPPYMAAYGATKAAIRAITQASAFEWGKYGITVNCYTPGAIVTTMTQALGNQFGPDLNSDIIFAEEEKKTAGGFIGKPEDVSALVSYLASPESHFMTGQAININGGRQFD